MIIDAQDVAEALSHVPADVLTGLARVQDSEGIRLDDDTWCWVTCFIDLDYEYGYLVDVRRNEALPNGDYATRSDYLAIFDGVNRTGRKVTAQWWGHSALFPQVPNLYNAIQWWGQWLQETRKVD